MPSGPSHSHSSGGGSSHSSSSRGFSSGGFSGGGVRVPRAPWHWHFGGRTVVISTGKQNVFLAMLGALIVFIIATFGCLGIKSGIKGQIKQQTANIEIFESDAEWYKNVITKAKSETGEEEGYYLTTATFDKKQILYYDESDPKTGYYEYDTVNGVYYFYIIYKYTNQKTGEVVTAETYAQFTSSQAQGWNGEIAYAYSEEDSAWFAINTNYSLDKNMEYVKAKQLLKSSNSSLKSMKVAFVVCLVVTIGLAVGFVFVTKNIIKKAKAEAAAEEAKQQAEIEEAKADAEEAKSRASKVNRYCSYCGCKISDDVDQCPSCGSRVFKK